MMTKPTNSADRKCLSNFHSALLKFIVVVAVVNSDHSRLNAQPFTNINAQFHPDGNGFFRSSVVAADFNNDGQMDFLSEGGYNGTAFDTVWINTSSGNFSDAIDLNDYGSAPYSGACAAADFYNVGQMDVLVTGTDANSGRPLTQLWHDSGSNNFLLISGSGLPAATGGFLAIADLNNDGKIDVVLSGYTNGNQTGLTFAQFWKGAGNGIFGKVNIGLPNFRESLFAVDFDNDGYVDILAGTTLLKNLGHDTFTNVVSGISGAPLAVGDFNNDGYPDVLVANGNYQIWLNTGNGTFTNSNIVLPALPTPSGLFPAVAAVGDYDNDGRLDIVLETGGYNTPMAQVWRNLGNGTFTNAQSVAGATTGSLTWADFNGDSRLDFLMTGQQGTTFNGDQILVKQIWQNTLANSNSPPTAPTNLTTNVTGSGVKLMWAAATDDHTPSSGLNYNIRVGSTSGGVDIVSPESDPVTGQRRVVQIGNAYERLFSLLTNLSGGKYYWSVQAIDTAFAGGPFGTESAFVIPPSITSWAYQSNSQFQVTFNALATNSYTLQASTNLTQWTNLTTVIPTTNGPAQLADTNFLSFPRRYYRLSSP